MGNTPPSSKEPRPKELRFTGADETGLRSDDVRGRSYAPIGQTPEIRLNQRREGLSIVSSVTNRGKVRFKSFEGGMNAAILIDFMKRLVQEVRKRTEPKCS